VEEETGGFSLTGDRGIGSGIKKNDGKSEKGRLRSPRTRDVRSNALDELEDRQRSRVWGESQNEGRKKKEERRSSIAVDDEGRYINESIPSLPSNCRVVSLGGEMIRFE